MSTRKHTAAVSGPAPTVVLLNQWEEVLRHLEVVRSTACCIEYALYHQNAEKDADFALCIRENVINELTGLMMEVQETRGVLNRLSGQPGAPHPSS
jgi:hypothetical protein